MKFVRRFSAVLIGIVFFTAGILKLMDPVGTGLIVEEYFKFFHLRFLNFLSNPAGLFLALLETLSGAALITGVFRKAVSTVVGILIFGFTAITLILLIFNPTMDCGCFGEALHLTHLQSFIKNIVLCALWVTAFIPYSTLGKPAKIKYISFSLAVLVISFFTIHGVTSVPMIDFTPFAPGTELTDMLRRAEDEVNILSFSDAEGQYADTLAIEGEVFVVSSYNPSKLSKGQWKKISEFMNGVEDMDFRPLLLVASTPSSIAEIEGAPSGAYFADRKELLTLNRSNGGCTMISDGEIIAKWPLNGLPEKEKIIANRTEDPTEAMMAHNTRKRLTAQFFIVGTLALMLIL